MKKMLARYPIGNPRRKWKQDNFTLSLFEPGPMGLERGGPVDCEKARRGMQTAKDAGFKSVDLCWASPEIAMEMVRTAEQICLPLMYQNLLRFGGMGYRKEKNLRPEDNDLEGVMRDIAPWKWIHGLVIYDEPILPEQRTLVRDMISRFEEVYPDRLPFACTDAGMIDEMADEVDPVQLSFDQYPFGGWVGDGMTPDGQMDGCTTYWRNMETGRRAAKRIEAPYWFIYQGHELPYIPMLDSYTFTASRMMANAALLYGAKGVSAYVECDGVLDAESGGHGIYFGEQKKLNQEIDKLGNTLMALECQRVIHDESVVLDTETTEYPTMEDSELLTGELPHRISISELKDAYGNDYLMVLNRDYRKATRYILKMKDAMRVWRVSDVDGEQYLAFDDDSNSIVGTLEAGCIALYRLQPRSEKPYAIGYYLDKGMI